MVLCVTGGEALYADMGHFGRRPIRIAWFTVVLPALLLNYFGQGALLLRDPDAPRRTRSTASSPALAALPAGGARDGGRRSIASQALISGAFSLTQQAIQLGYSPRLTSTHTSEHEAARSTSPRSTGALMVGCVALVFGFGSSTNLAAAYGIAVTGTMVITSILLHRRRAQQLALAALARLRLSLPSSSLIDLAFSRRQRDQDRARRLVPARRGGDRVSS